MLTATPDTGSLREWLAPGTAWALRDGMPTSAYFETDFNEEPLVQYYQNEIHIYNNVGEFHQPRLLEWVRRVSTTESPPRSLVVDSSSDVVLEPRFVQTLFGLGVEQIRIHTRGIVLLEDVTDAEAIEILVEVFPWYSFDVEDNIG